MAAGFLGAEIATWWALSPSLLPRPWWVTAMNLAVCQAVGHATATALASTFRRLSARAIPAVFTNAAHFTIGTITLIAGVVGLKRQRKQADLMGVIHRGPTELAAGMAVGTAGYAALLIAGELAQHGADRIQTLVIRVLPSWVRWLSWPIAVGAVSVAVILLGDHVILRRMFTGAAHKAALLNQLVFPGTEQPWEPERSASPWSHERWGAVGSQGRTVLSGGPRSTDITHVTGLDPTEVHEPIRLFAGLVPGRSPENQAHLLIAEMRRTGALHRDTIVIHTSTGTGWITDWSTAAVEFLTGGNCVTISMQYSYLPSALSWYRDNDAPIKAARMLIDAVSAELNQIPAGGQRPRLYLAGESLGAYGTAGAYGNISELLHHADGVMLSGTPRFSEAMHDLVRSRQSSSPERLPIINGGKHIRFVAHPGHLAHDHRGDPYKHDWDFPRVLVARHASDPIVWWDAELFIRRPDWLRETGPQQLDVFPRLLWVPFVTGWQLALDLLVSVDVPGGHGHNYHGEFLNYWAALLGRREGVPVTLTSEFQARAEKWIRENSVKR